MKKTVKIIFATLISLLYTLPVSASTTITLSKPPQVADSAGASIDSMVDWIITTLSIIGVIASLIFLLYGGIKWITSGGDKAAVDSARNHVIAAIIGLVIVVLSFVILNVVFQLLGLSGLPTTLTIPSL